jgi:hypothetical protein
MSYVPIEEILPDWKAARTVISSLVPCRLGFAVTADSLSLDLSFLPQIQNVARCSNFSEICEVHDRIRLIRTMVPETLPPPKAWAPLLGRLASDVDPSECSEILENHSVMREAIGLPSTLQVIRHHLGLRPCPGLV